jgi:hypothetical protein
MNAKQRAEVALAKLGTPAVSTEQPIDKRIVGWLGQLADKVEDRTIGDDGYWATFQAARLEHKVARLLQGGRVDE